MANQVSSTRWKGEYCDQHTPELIRDRFIVGINDITLMTKLINSAMKDPRIYVATIATQAYEATKTKLERLYPDVEEQANFS